MGERILVTDHCPEHEAGHCWHGFDQAVFAIRNPPRHMKCCHCGRYGHFEWQYDSPKHGKYHPNPGGYVLTKVTEARHERP